MNLTRIPEPMLEKALYQAWLDSRDAQEWRVTVQSIAGRQEYDRVLYDLHRFGYTVEAAAKVLMRTK